MPCWVERVLANRIHNDKGEGYKVLEYVDGYLPFNWTWQEMGIAIYEGGEGSGQLSTHEQKGRSWVGGLK